LLACIVIVSVTGYLLPWSRGADVDFAGLFSVPSPFASNRIFHEIVEETHELAGNAFLPLVGLHLLGVLKHLLVDRDAIFSRMMKPIRNGR
jgi:cytochrome b561